MDQKTENVKKALEGDSGYQMLLQASIAADTAYKSFQLCLGEKYKDQPEIGNNVEGFDWVGRMPNDRKALLMPEDKDTLLLAKESCKGINASAAEYITKFGHKNGLSVEQMDELLKDILRDKLIGNQPNNLSAIRLDKQNDTKANFFEHGAHPSGIAGRYMEEAEIGGSKVSIQGNEGDAGIGHTLTIQSGDLSFRVTNHGTMNDIQVYKDGNFLKKIDDNELQQKIVEAVGQVVNDGRLTLSEGEYIQKIVNAGAERSGISKP